MVENTSWIMQIEVQILALPLTGGMTLGNHLIFVSFHFFICKMKKTLPMSQDSCKN